MASLFWVGGTGSYDGTTNHFATTTGGTASVAAVTSADTVTFDSNSGTGTVTMTANWSSGSVTVNSSNITLTTNGTATFTVATASTLTLTLGTINTNGSTCSWGIFSSTNSNVRTLTLGGTQLTMTGAGGSGLPWNTSTVTNFTFNANTSTITFTGGNANLATGTLTFNNVVFGTGATACVLNMVGPCTFNNITKTNGAVTTDSISVATSNITVNGTFTVTGNSLVNRMMVKCNLFGTTRTITAAAVSFTNVDFRDITAAGAAAPFTGTSMGDAGGNTNITTDTPVTRFWVGNGGGWNSTAHWSASTGGATGASVPLVHDTVVFDSNSITLASQTITYNVPRASNVDFSNVLNNPTFANSSSGPELYGNLTFKSGMTITGTSTINIHSRTNSSITTNTVTITFPLATNTTATYTFADDYISSNTLTHSFGTLTTSGNVQCTTFASSNSNSRTINMGSSTWTLTGTGIVWNTSTTTGLTFNNPNATVIVSDTSATAKTFALRQTLGTLTVTGTGGATVSFDPGATYTNLNLGKNGIYNFSTSSNTTIGVLNAIGDAVNGITIQSQTAGTLTVFKMNNTNSVSYCTFKDINANAQHSIWASDGTNTNNGNNSNVIFTQPKRLAVGGVG